LKAHATCASASSEEEPLIILGIEARARATAALYPEIVGVDDVMGCVMAHELGHLLLHSNTHSSEGIMRAEFRQIDLINGVQRRVVFTPAERETIRTNLRDRGKVQ